MASSSLNAEEQKRMRVMSLDYLKNSLLRKTSPKTVCCCNENLGLNLEHEHTFTDLDCNSGSVELKSGPCKKCGKTKIKNKSGLFKFLRKWLWWQNSFSADPVNKCPANNEGVANLVDNSFPLVPSDNKSKDSLNCIECINRPCSNISVSENDLDKLNFEGAGKSLTLDLDKARTRCTESSKYSLDNETLQMDDNLGVDSSNLVNVDISNTSNTQNCMDVDRETTSDPLNFENEPLPSPTARSLTCELLKLSKFGWYWGPISREEAEDKLQDQPDGAFLVRDSSASHYLLSLSFRSSGKILHARIEHRQGLFSFYNQPEQGGFATIEELIDHSVSLSQSAVFCYSRPRSPGHPSFPVRLTKPVSRFTQVKTLQYLCRFIIRQYVTIDNIDSLPLPNILKKYVEESHY